MPNLSKTRLRVDREMIVRRRRAPWRQRLVDAERGFTLGFRGDSALFVHLFLVSLVLAGGFVLGLSLAQWTALTVALTLVLTAEMFQQALKSLLLDGSEQPLPEPMRRALRMGTAAVMLAIVGTFTTVGLLLAQRLTELLAE